MNGAWKTSGTVIFVMCLVSICCSAEDVFIVSGPKKLDREAIKQSETVADNLISGGTVVTNCSVLDQKEVYVISDSQRSAIRAYVEQRSYIYGVANGVGPIFPGVPEECPSSTIEKIVIWPTLNCGDDLSLEQAMQYASEFNKRMCALIMRSKQSETPTVEPLGS